MAERWKFTPHAKERMTEMGVDRREVLTGLCHPEVTYDGPQNHPQGRQLALAGRLAIVFEPAPEKRIITVLWRGKEFTRASAMRIQVEVIDLERVKRGSKVP